MSNFQAARRWLNDKLTPDGRNVVLWLIGIGAVFGFVWITSVSPDISRVSWAAIEYALVAALMGTASGYGRMVYDDLQKNGAFSAVRYVVIGLFLLALGFYFVSIIRKPGFLLYLIGLSRGKGACTVILCSALYGFFAQKSDAKRRRQAQAKTRASTQL
jgi:hypothetical protein